MILTWESAQAVIERLEAAIAQFERDRAADTPEADKDRAQISTLHAALLELTEYYAHSGCDNGTDCDCPIHQMWNRVNVALGAPLPPRLADTDALERPLRDMSDEALAWRAGDAVIARDWDNLWHFTVEYRYRLADRTKP